MALYGPGVGVAPPAPKRRRATGTVSFEFLPGEGGESRCLYLAACTCTEDFAFCFSATQAAPPASEPTQAAPPASEPTQAAPPASEPAPGPVVVHAEIHRPYGLDERDEGMQ